MRWNGFSGQRLATSIVAVAWLCLPEVSFGQKISSGYVEEYSLASLKTFAFAVQERAAPDELVGRPSAEAQIKEVLGEELEAAGFQEVTQSPDFLVAFYSHHQLRMSYRDLGAGAPQQFGTSHYEVGHLYVDLLAFPSKEAVWSGVASKSLRQGQGEKLLRKACRRLVKTVQKDARTQDEKKQR